MKRKIVGILVMTLLIATAVLPVVGIMNEGKPKTVEKSIEGKERFGSFLPLSEPSPFLTFTCIDSDWDYGPNKNTPRYLYPYVEDMIILFGHDPPENTYSADEPRIQADAWGGARILGTQGNTPEKPAIGFFSTNGVDDGAGCGNGIYRPLAHHMAFSTLSQERMRITDKGLVGIGTTYPVTPNDFGSGPNSRLHVDGSFATAITTVVAGSTYPGPILGINDHSVFITGDGWVSLPWAYTCPGRQYMIKNIGTSTIQLDCEGLYDLIEGAAPYNPYPLNPKDSIIVVSDGKGAPPHTQTNYGNWWIMGEFDPEYPPK